MASLSSCSGILASLREDDDLLKGSALRKLQMLVDDYWSEISESVASIEVLYEDDSFPYRKEAALLASRVFYHLGEMKDSVNYALGAEEKLDVTEKSEYVDTIVAECVDEYISQRNSDVEVDSRLTAVVERMFENCFEEGEFKQALGIALESKRLDIASESIRKSPDLDDMLRYCFDVALTVVKQRNFRRDVVEMLVSIHRNVSLPDYISIGKCLLVLEDVEALAKVFDDLLSGSEEQAALAYQIGFDISESELQGFLKNVVGRIEATPVDNAVVKDRRKNLKEILEGTKSIKVQLEFLSKKSKADANIVKNLQDNTSALNSTIRNGIVLANAIMNNGTSNDSFIRNNVDWLGQSANWSKYIATAASGMIHQGNMTPSMSVLGAYLPNMGSNQTGGAYAEGGALFALGLVHKGHGDSVVEYLKNTLKNSIEVMDGGESKKTEVLLHGGALGVGLAAMATNDMEIYENLTTILRGDAAVSGEAAGIAAGLIMLGSGNESVASDLLNFAHDTQHEKIIRGASLGVALVMFGREEGSEGIIEQMVNDQDAIVRYGSMFVTALAYCGTANNKAIRRVLHLAVSDVSDDVRRAAVMSLGFILSSMPSQCPKVVALLSESFNPHVRYGSAMALGIACAGTGSEEALRLLHPLSKDPIEYVRQGAYIAMSMILIQQNSKRNPYAKEARELFEKSALEKREDLSVKFGALLASGIIDAGGRNVTISLRSKTGHARMTSAVGMALFCQYWYWYPFAPFLSLCFHPTALIGLNTKLQLPTISVRSCVRPSLFAYPPPIELKKEKAPVKGPSAVLSTAARAKARKGEKPAESKEVQEDVMKEEEQVEGGKKEEEQAFEVLENPARVVPEQERFISWEAEERYRPVNPVSRSGICVLIDSKPSEDEAIVSDGTGQIGVTGAGMNVSEEVSISPTAATPLSISQLLCCLGEGTGTPRSFPLSINSACYCFSLGDVSHTI